MIYLDSSAVVKLYVAEAETGRMRAVVAGDPAIVTARITFAEVAAGLAAAARLGRIAAWNVAMAKFETDWVGYIAIEIDQLLVESAADLAARHGLRGYDAVQLSAALSAAGGRRARLRFASFDIALARAAVAEGFQPAI